MDLSVLEIDDVQELGFDLSSPPVHKITSPIPPVDIPTLTRSNPISPEGVKHAISVKMNVIGPSQNQKPMQQAIPRVYAKQTRYPIQQVKNPPITYGDIMTKMGLFVVNGELHMLKDGKNGSVPPPQEGANVDHQESHQHSYIHNKYFSKVAEPKYEPQVPRTAAELRDMLIGNIVQKHRIRHIKSTKMPLLSGGGHYISGNIVPGDMNKLFAFSRNK